MEPDDLSDEFLIECIAGGAIWALERLHQRYRGRCYALAYRITADAMAAEELVQDAFYSVWQRATTYTPQAGTARRWLFSVVYHCTIDYMRRRRNDMLYLVPLHTAEEAEHPSFDGLWEQIEHRALRSTLHASLARLPTEQQTAISLAYFEGWTHQEIAQHSHIPLGTVKTRIRLGIRHLRHILTQAADDEAVRSNHTRSGTRASKPVTVIVQVRSACRTTEQREDAPCAPSALCATGYEVYQGETCQCFRYTEWEALLERIDAFTFTSEAGSFLARKEQRAHGRTYWYAYAWGGDGRRKAYLGRPSELTLTRMEAMARQLQEQAQPH